LFERHWGEKGGERWIGDPEWFFRETYIRKLRDIV
jgi:hypothetical protein